MDRRKVLLDLLTAPVPMHVAPAADVHQHVEGERVAAAEFLDEFVIRSPMAERHADGVLLLLLRPVAHDRENLAVGRLRHAVQQRGDGFIQRIVRFDKIDRFLRSPCGGLIEARFPQRVLGITGQVGVDGRLILVRLGMAGERGGHRFIEPGRLSAEFTPDVHGGPPAGVFEILADHAKFGQLGRQ